jgi:hypothetical protein
MAIIIVFSWGVTSAQTSEFPIATATQASYIPGDVATILGYEYEPGQESLPILLGSLCTIIPNLMGLRACFTLTSSTRLP